MSTITIDFTALSKAAHEARSAASELEEYAEALEREVRSPIAQLTGGSSSNTQIIASEAMSKRAALTAKAERYRFGATAIENFSQNAAQAESTIAKRVKKVADNRAANLPWWKKAGRVLNAIFNKTIGQTGIGEFMRQIGNWNDAIDDYIARSMKKAYNWFKRGEGRYWLKIIESVAGFIGAIATFVGTLPASGVISIFVAIMAGVAMVKSLSDMAASAYSGFKALQLNDSEPGLARYRAKASSASDMATQYTTNKTLQNILKWTDAIGDLCGVGVSGASLFRDPKLNVKNMSDKNVTYSFNKETISINFHDKLGFRPKTTGKAGWMEYARDSKGKIKYEWKNNYFGIDFSKKTDAGKVPDLLQTRLDKAKKYTNKINKVAKPVKVQANNIKYATQIGEQNFTDDPTGVTKSTVKVLTSPVSGLSGPNDVLSALDTLIDLVK